MFNLQWSRWIKSKLQKVISGHLWQLEILSVINVYWRVIQSRVYFMPCNSKFGHESKICFIALLWHWTLQTCSRGTGLCLTLCRGPYACLDIHRYYVYMRNLEEMCEKITQMPLAYASRDWVLSPSKKQQQRAQSKWQPLLRSTGDSSNKDVRSVVILLFNASERHLEWYAKSCRKLPQKSRSVSACLFSTCNTVGAASLHLNMWNRST